VWESRRDEGVRPKVEIRRPKEVRRSKAEVARGRTSYAG